MRQALTCTWFLVVGAALAGCARHGVDFPGPPGGQELTRDTGREQGLTGGESACDDDACGPAPLGTFLCDDGEVADTVCTRRDDGVCGWDFVCPAVDDVCSDEECGPAPLGTFLCDDGEVADTVCTRRDDGVCGWDFVCPAVDDVCSTDECGPPPEAAPCEGGETAPLSCERDDGGLCVWAQHCGEAP